MGDTDTFDSRAFRHALGCFATGVTVVTCCDPDGAPVGVTANSFSSVSLDPPLVLWSLSRRSGSFEAFNRADCFAVHLLKQNQIDVSNNFARTGDKFREIAYRIDAKAPILDERLALFRCDTEYRYEGGDHIIFVGRVRAFEFGDDEPLLFAQGEYAASILHPLRLKELKCGLKANEPMDIEYWL
ncbi:MAG: flavin reductase family protein [Pseudomonadota bacterium]